MSKVWKVFTTIQKAGTSFHQCSICETTLTKRKDSGTSHLKKHIERRHYDKYKELFESGKQKDISNAITNSSKASSSSQPTLMEFTRTKEPLKRDSPKAKAITQGILEMLVLDLQPTSFTEDSGFRALMKTTESRYVIPSRSTFRNTLIPDLYSEILSKVRGVVEDHMKQHGTISLTTDAWTSLTTGSFITYTLHFIKEDFTMVCYNIGTFEYKESHTADNLKNHVYTALYKVGILEPPQPDADPESDDDTDTVKDNDDQTHSDELSGE